MVAQRVRAAKSRGRLVRASSQAIGCYDTFVRAPHRAAVSQALRGEPAAFGEVRHYKRPPDGQARSLETRSSLMPTRPSTRERIVNGSLALFNQRGERSVTTNHIAAHLDISPGNLYYHFPNKQAIVAILFEQYEVTLDDFLRAPEGRSATLDDHRSYLEALLAAMWNYRFLQRDLEHLLDSDPDLAARYRAFSVRCLAHAQAIYRAFVAAGILRMDPVQIESLTLNAWIVVSSWVRFLSTTQGDSADLGEEAFKRGVYQLLVLEQGFVTEPFSAAFQQLCETFYVPLNPTPAT